jgi:hypothetical protein
LRSRQVLDLVDEITEAISVCVVSRHGPMSRALCKGPLVGGTRKEALDFVNEIFGRCKESRLYVLFEQRFVLGSALREHASAARRHLEGSHDVAIPIGAPYEVHDNART